MRNQRSLDLLFGDAAHWLESRHLMIYGDRIDGGPVRDFVFGSLAELAPDPGAAGSAARRGWRGTQGNDRGRAARIFGPAAGMGANLAEGVAERVGYFPMLSAAEVNLSAGGIFTPIAGFGAARFAVTSQLTGCCFVWDKANARVAHIRPAGRITGAALRRAFADHYTVFGSRGEGGGAGDGEYDIGEDVAIVATNNGGWRFFAQVHVRMTTRIQRVVEL